ncbi:MAG TPA: glucokinase [Oligoflexus sp.]|uniref:glucokinase n=1 Tax=Oligoflexus sp. TaxID=1971216 RepID=UPI002D54700E|nr:glucokinase [Oligoflexus sp.]HYX33743.1 glucokinase [Oligoflexus sp.]
MNHYLVADVGGTNARLGLVTTEGNEVFGIEQLSNKDYPHLLDVVNAYLSRAQCIVLPKKACFAVASPVAGDRIHFTNNSWSFSIQELKAQLGLEYLKVMNDFEAVALSIPYLGPREVFRVGTGAAVPHRTIAVMGPGTGLGMAALVPNSPKPLPLATEGGHACFAPQDELEVHIASRIKQRLGFCSNEDLLSGSGLVSIYEGLCDWYKSKGTFQNPSDITTAALEGTDDMSRLSLERFCAVLGSVAGDYALQIGAQGGVYIAGGIVPRFKEFLAEHSSFRERFVSKGRFRNYLEAIPTYVIIAPQPGLVGAASVFDEGQ